MLVWEMSTRLSPMYTIPAAHASLPHVTTLHITGGAVVLLAGVDCHPGRRPGPLCSVEHMGHAQQAQVISVPGSGSEVRRLFSFSSALAKGWLYMGHYLNCFVFYCI